MFMYMYFRIHFAKNMVNLLLTLRRIKFKIKILSGLHVPSINCFSAVFLCAVYLT